MGRVGEGLSSYYKAKIEELEIQARDKQINLRRLEAQRNELNTKGDQMLLKSAALSREPSHNMIEISSLVDFASTSCSEIVERRASASSGTRIVCRGGHQGE